MKSPFPGMDPYLEQHWRDVHARLITYSCDQLQPRLGGGLVARMEERVIVDLVDPEDLRAVNPDVQILSFPDRQKAFVAKGGTAVAEPVIVEQVLEKYPQRFVEIRDRKDGSRLITVIEVLSPSNKRPGKNREEYLRKKAELYDADVSIVEIDLIRIGDSVYDIPGDKLPMIKQELYSACVYRGYRQARWEYYGMPFRNPLSTIGIPLRRGDSDIPLDIQALVDKTYMNGAYDVIDYSQDPVPPLNAVEAKWADGLLKAAGSRR